MPREKRQKTVEELTEGFLRAQLKMKQNIIALQTGEKTRQDLVRRARELAEEQFRRNMERQGEIAKASDNVRLTLEEIEAYRQERLEAYQDAFEWNDANDKASLDALVELETQLYVIRHDLQMPKLSDTRRENLMKLMGDFTKQHADIQAKLGIDKKSRDAAKRNEAPMEKFEREILRFHRFMQERLDSFPAAADNVDSEKNLRELIRYKTGWDFKIIDAIIRNTKRLNGLEPVVEEYE